MLSKQRAALEGEVKRYTTGELGEEMEFLEASNHCSNKRPMGVLGWSPMHRTPTGHSKPCGLLCHAANCRLRTCVHPRFAQHSSALPAAPHRLHGCTPYCCLLLQATWCTRGWTTGRRVGGRCRWTSYPVRRRRLDWVSVAFGLQGWKAAERRAGRLLQVDQIPGEFCPLAYAPQQAGHGRWLKPAACLLLRCCWRAMATSFPCPTLFC